MYSTFYKAATGLLFTIATVALISGCGQSYAERLGQVGDGTVTVTGKERSGQKTYNVSPDAAVTLDGEPAALDDIDTGDAKTYQGTVVSKTDKQLLIKDRENAWMEFHVTDGTEVTLDGDEIPFDELQVGLWADVNAHLDGDKLTATNVDAMSPK